MFFRNVSFLRFPLSVDFSHTAEMLPLCQLKPVGPLEMASQGFISPFGREETEVLHHQIGSYLWLAIGREDKMLPGSVVNDQLANRIAEIEGLTGQKLGGRERKRLKDDLLHELMPRAFTKSKRTDVILDLANGYAAINSSSRKTVESVASEIRGMLGSFPAAWLNAEVAPRSVLTSWIAGEELPYGLALGEEAELRDPMEGGAVIKAKDQELHSDEIDKHLDAGKQVTKLALVLEDNLSFVLGDDLVVRKLKILDGALDQLEDFDPEDRDGRRAELDARFALQSGEIRRLFLQLEQAFKISKGE